MVILIVPSIWLGALEARLIFSTALVKTKPDSGSLSPSNDCCNNKETLPNSPAKVTGLLALLYRNAYDIILIPRDQSMKRECSPREVNPFLFH